MTGEHGLVQGVGDPKAAEQETKKTTSKTPASQEGSKVSRGALQIPPAAAASVAAGVLQQACAQMWVLHKRLGPCLTAPLTKELMRRLGASGFDPPAGRTSPLRASLENLRAWTAWTPSAATASG